MSRLKTLLPVANASTRNTQQPAVHACNTVAQRMHATQQPTVEEWRRQLLAMLAENPTFRRVVFVSNPNTNPVMVAIGIRDVATFELAIPAARFDWVQFGNLAALHTGMVH